MSLLNALEWRYATKKMNGAIVPQDKLAFILKATQLSASSFGLQPYTILVISNPELKAKLQPHAYNQSQIVDCSHLLVFAAWTSVSEKQVDDFIANAATTRNLPVSALQDFRNYVWGTVSRLDATTQQAWASKQVYIALGTALAAAGEVEVDATPMEGFVPAEFDEVLGLKEKGLASVALLPLGFRSEDDWLSKLAKVRRSADELFQIIE
jgi:nitroreductase / dihydropteridine reductase